MHESTRMYGEHLLCQSNGGEVLENLNTFFSHWVREIAMDSWTPNEKNKQQTLSDHCLLGWLSKFGTNSCKQLEVKLFLCHTRLKILLALPSSQD